MTETTNNSQILNSIQNLQQIEKQLFSNLEQNIGNNNLTDQQKNDIINKINQVSQNRINLYKSLGLLNTYYQQNLSNTSNILSEQQIAVKIVEEELNESKRRLESIKQDQINKLRLVEINRYYGDRYSEHSKIMKIIIAMFLPILILSILAKKGLLSSRIYSVLVVIITLFGVPYLIGTYMSIISRDNMNYQEYNWYFDANTAPTTTTDGSSNSVDPWVGSQTLCQGQQCCYTGSTWDASQNLCVPDATVDSTSTYDSTSTSTNTCSTVSGFENMNNAIFTKYSYVNKKPDVTLGQNTRAYNY
jgi:hypothetical protein